MRWIMTGHNIGVLDGANHSLASHFFGTSESFCVSNDASRMPLLPSGLKPTPVMRYTSYFRFNMDLRANLPHSGYKWVMYDPENWEATPDEEQKFPLIYMKLFGQRAHAAGYRVLMQPARNLALVSKESPRGSQESLDSWYLRSGVPQIAVCTAEGLLIQSQAHQTELSEWQALLTQGREQALKSNPFSFICGAVSTAHGTADEMFAAATWTTTSGFYVTMGDDTVKVATDFFSRMQKAGY